MNKKLKVVAPTELKGYTILTIDPPATRFFLGHGNTNYLCGVCNATLATSVNQEDFSNKLLKCNSCQSVNLITGKKKFSKN